MRWRGRRSSSNVEDLRGSGRTGGGGRAMRIGRSGGVGGLGIIAIALAAMFFGVDPRMVLGLLDGGTAMAPQSTPATGQPAGSAPDDQLGAFVSVVLADTEDTWNTLFGQMNRRYQEPRLVLFSDAVRSACGAAEAAMGPFYCPADQKVYIDLSFYRDLKNRHQAPGDFAQAYVIAHEVGHHVQTLLGISSQVHQARQRASKVEANALSVRQELQADCFAGLWASHTERSKQILEQGDVEEALTAASAIGDDRLQRQSRGRVVPESFTHGTSDQRVRWFRRGLDSGQVADCDTFNAASL